MKVKVNRVRGGSMGDQRNYGLVTGSIWNYEDKPSSNEVSDTLGPVDRDQATIEAERGETVIYPDKDGEITHAKIGGKRHTHGGTPLDIPDGAFVFSDTRALLIKNKELLKNIFGMNTNKAVTPAKVAQRYDLNQYKDILNDPESDFLDKKTAQLMLENNLKKLGQLALVQEGMKGFPDGIPDIALPLFGSDIAAQGPSEQMPQAKFGGQIMRRGGKKLPKHQNFGEVDKSRFSAKEQENIAKFMGKWGAKLGYNPIPSGEWSSAGSNIDMNNSAAFDQHLVDIYNDAMKASRNAYTLPTVEITGEYPRVSTLPDDDPAQRAAVEKANQLYNEAINSNDPKKMKEAADLIDKMDISGWSTPAGTLAEGARIVGTGLYNAILGQGSIFTDPFLIRTHLSGIDPGINLRSKEPFGLTWQEKINDMRDILNRRSKEIPVEKASKKDIESRKNIASENVNKQNELDIISNEIINNPKKYTTEQVIDATNYLSDRNSYQFKWAADPKSGHINESLDTYYNALLGPGKIPQATEAQIKAAATDTSGTSQKTALNPLVKTGYENVVAPAASASRTPSAQPAAKSKSTGARSQDQVIQDLIDAGFKREEITPELIQAEMSGPQGYAKGGVTYVFDPTNNIMLDTYQGKGTVKKRFNIYDKTFRDYATQNKLKLVLPSWATGQTTIGSQNPSIDPTFKRSATGEIIPSAGIAGYTGPDDLIKWHKSQGMDFSKYVDASGNTAKDEADGMTKFKADLASWDNSGKKHRHATSWMLGKVDEINTERATKLGLSAPPSQTDKGVTGWDVTGFDVLTGTKYLEPEDTLPPLPPGETPKPKYKCVDGKAVATTDGTGYDTAEEALKNCGVLGKVPTPQYTGGYPSRWSDYSEMNLATAMGMANQVEPGALPAFTQVFPDLGRPVYMDPTASIMRQLALQNQQAEMIAGMSDPTVGRANIIASAAKTADPISDIMAKYDQANAQIANTFEGQRAAMTNEAQVKNAALRKQFQDELVTRRQNYLNAQKEAAANVAYQYERGAKDFAERNALNVQNPNYGIDPYGRVFFKPGYNPNATASSTTDDLLDKYIDKGIDPNKAAALIAAQMKLNDNAFNYDPMSSIWSSQKPVN